MSSVIYVRDDNKHYEKNKRAQPCYVIIYFRNQFSITFGASQQLATFLVLLHSTIPS
jgi:hypothetical protein